MPSRPALVPTLLVLVLARCGDTVTILHCPKGTLPEGDHCVPICPPDEVAVGESCVPKPAATPDAGGDATDFPTADAGDDAAVPDTGPTPDASPGGATGAPCGKGADCDGGTCLDWPGGYCTALDCDGGSCAGGDVCAPLPGGNQGCLAGCSSGSDCREGEQACKALPLGGGAVRSACHGVEAPGGGLGDTCAGDVACAGAAVCLPSMPGGYCAILGCDAAPCPDGGVCVPFGGVATCLRACDDDADCGGAPGAERRCAPLKALDKTKVEVCISGAAGGKVGDACLNDFECATGACEVLGEGVCTQSGEPCFEATEDVDCTKGGFCLVTGQNQVGVCTQPCSLELPCPGASACVGLPGSSPEGLCRPLCGGPGREDDCPSGPGFTCAFGRPLGDTSGQGAYVCATLGPGSVGAACEGPDDCPGATCQTGGCALDCGDDLYCPFPGTCVATSLPGTCRKSCLSVLDCPSGSTCGTPPGSIGQVCL